jgi:hypothetical protein
MRGMWFVSFLVGLRTYQHHCKLGTGIIKSRYMLHLDSWSRKKIIGLRKVKSSI